MSSDGAQSQLPDADKLVTFMRSCIADFATRRTRHISEARAREFKMTFGCCVQTVRYAEAYLVLCENGLSLEARAPARSALEHAVTAEYAYLRRDGLDQLAASADHTSWSIRDRMHRWTGVEGYRPGPEPSGSLRLPSVTGERGDRPSIMRTLDPDDVLLHPGYAVLSQGVHVTNQTLSGFFVMNEDRSEMQIRHHRGDDLADYTRFLVAEACMLVAWIYAHVTENQARLDELDALSDQLHLPIRLDGDWPADDRAH
jgi:hypothetical protein